jgi:DNA-binding CsgD family transcriptional regulator
MPDLNLTPRQLQIVRMIDQGMTYEEMGEALGVSPSTVKAHTNTLRYKLNVKKKRHIPQALRETGATF